MIEMSENIKRLKHARDTIGAAGSFSRAQDKAQAETRRLLTQVIGDEATYNYQKRRRELKGKNTHCNDTDCLFCGQNDSQYGTKSLA